ncbi:Neopullulanase [Posidoniimonas polymericola]|uniref:Neopullulanase n=1 Tax=Posidoniimonas polymericola TaxID=2528002 RepID=A0A5C5YUE4_9BACT|nr:alpha-amylase family glycosyl hydrolase [Posidoniimonas polymericola]TWT78451.1 Neopullulanase [Posidoniimonas polymericola]
MDASDVWYHLFPLGFLEAEEVNPDPGGEPGGVTHRLPALVGWLDYLVDLGVTGVLLGPVFESETHGYDTVDPLRIDRRLGDEADLVALIEECHRRSLVVALDAVLHHVGRRHPYFQDVLARGEQSAYCDWFEIDFSQPGHDGFAYANFEGHGQLVKLNHANPLVLDWAVNFASYWIERGVDAYRLDAAYALPTPFVSAFANRVRGLRSDLFLLGEVIHGDYVRTAKRARLSSVTQYELWKAVWSSLNDGNFFELAHAIQRHTGFCERFRPWTFLSNHDTTHIATQLEDSRHCGHALALLMTLPGVPAVYAGDEQSARGRKYDREGGDAEVRRPPPQKPNELSGEQLASYQQHQQLIAARRQRPWLATGEVNVVELQNRQMTYEVLSGDARAFVALSTDDAPTTVQLPPDLLHVAGNVDTHLPPRGWGVWASD